MDETVKIHVGNGLKLTDSCGGFTLPGANMAGEAAGRLDGGLGSSS